jgi:hypothetical protein
VVDDDQADCGVIKEGTFGGGVGDHAYTIYGCQKAGDFCLPWYL